MAILSTPMAEGETAYLFRIIAYAADAPGDEPTPEPSISSQPVFAKPASFSLTNDAPYVYLGRGLRKGK